MGENTAMYLRLSLVGTEEEKGRDADKKADGLTQGEKRYKIGSHRKEQYFIGGISDDIPPIIRNSIQFIKDIQAMLLF